MITHHVMITTVEHIYIYIYTQEVFYHILWKIDRWLKGGQFIINMIYSQPTSHVIFLQNMIQFYWHKMLSVIWSHQFYFFITQKHNIWYCTNWGTLCYIQHVGILWPSPKLKLSHPSDSIKITWIIDIPCMKEHTGWG